MTFKIGEQIYSDGVSDLVVVVHNALILGFIGADWQPLQRSDLPGAFELSKQTFIVGEYCGHNCSLIVLDPDVHPSAFEGFDWFSIRDLLPTVDEPLFLLASRALQLYTWCEDHQFCGRCGGKTVLSLTDRAWVCNSCDLQFYPRISPCVIGVITDGPRILLARGMKHKPELFSCIAGFIEPGESAEQAFAREILEEVGLHVNNIRYYGSQPWPFPSQLMLGFYAEYESGDIHVDGVEILEANWYTKDNLPELPSVYSISGTIIRDYLSTT